MSMLYTLVVMGVLLGFASMGVDLARVQVAKTELRRTADAAARAAAGSLASGVGDAEAAAMEIAAANTVDGAPLQLVPASDIEFGLWDTSDRSFTVLSGADRSGANAVRITTRRVASRGTAIPLVFAQALGRSGCDVVASSIATAQGSSLMFTGLGGISLKNNLETAVYRSSQDTTPTVGANSTGVTLVSNGSISGKNNNEIGGAILGPDAENNIPAGFTINLLADISLPEPSFSSTGTDMTITGTQTLAGGTYYIANLTLKNNAELRFGGPATLYISGDVIFQQKGEITAYNGIPANLVIQQKGTGDFGTSSANNIDVTADIYAPGVAFHCKNNATLRGRALFGSIEAKNNLELFYDQDLAPRYTGGVSGIATVR